MELRSVPAFLSADECGLLIHLANQKGMAPSRVVRHEENVSCERKSHTAWLTPDDHPFLAVLSERAGRLTGIDPRWFEELQVVRYDPGGYFEPHYDQCCEESEACAAETRRFGGRLRRYTLLVYLCAPDGYDGGETRFPRLGRSFKGAAGDALLFSSAHKDSLHEGTPVKSGIKWVCNLWMRPR
jgi:prolyl 4-hydroxylase